jgi:hypothetical protein
LFQAVVVAAARLGRATTVPTPLDADRQSWNRCTVKRLVIGRFMAGYIRTLRNAVDSVDGARRMTDATIL